MGEEATITKNANGTFSVTPKKQDYAFKDKFLQKYAIEKARQEAKREGYTVVEKQEHGETVLYLRQY